MQRYLADPAATEKLGAHLSHLCRPGTTLYLDGELGSGKTTLVRGFLRSLHCDGAVRSPTYTLVENYATPQFPVFHFDLYRVRSVMELETMGLSDFFDGGAVCLVEWPGRGAGYLPAADITVRLQYADPGRLAELNAGTPLGEDLMRMLGQ